MKMINWPAIGLTVLIAIAMAYVFDVIKLPEFPRIVIGLVLVVLMSDFIFKAVS